MAEAESAVNPEVDLSWIEGALDVPFFFVIVVLFVGACLRFFKFLRFFKLLRFFVLFLIIIQCSN